MLNYGAYVTKTGMTCLIHYLDNISLNIYINVKNSQSVPEFVPYLKQNPHNLP